MLQQLTALQWAEWKAYYDLEPFGEIRDDFRAGQICSTLANYSGKTRNEDAPPAHPSEFLPALAEFYKPKEPDGPRLLNDPVEQANLIRKVLFNKDE